MIDKEEAKEIPIKPINAKILLNNFHIIIPPSLFTIVILPITNYKI